MKTDPAHPDPACGSVVAALEDDPFYRSISEEFAGDLAQRRSVLTRYFAYSIEEGRALGRTVHLADPSSGVAVWLLPKSDEIRARAAADKRLFLEDTLGARGTRPDARPCGEPVHLGLRLQNPVRVRAVAAPVAGAQHLSPVGRVGTYRN